MNKFTKKIDDALGRVLQTSGRKLINKIEDHTKKSMMKNYDAAMKEKMKNPFDKFFIDNLKEFYHGQEIIDKCRELNIYYDDLFCPSVRDDSKLMANGINKGLPFDYAQKIAFNRLVVLQKIKLWRVEDLLVEWDGEAGLELIKKCRQTNTFILGAGEKWLKQCENNGIDSGRIMEASAFIDDAVKGNMFEIARLLKEYPRKDIITGQPVKS